MCDPLAELKFKLELHLHREMLENFQTLDIDAFDDEIIELLRDTDRDPFDIANNTDVMNWIVDNSVDVCGDYFIETLDDEEIDNVDVIALLNDILLAYKRDGICKESYLLVNAGDINITDMISEWTLIKSNSLKYTYMDSVITSLRRLVAKPVVSSHICVVCMENNEMFGFCASCNSSKVCWKCAEKMWNVYHAKYILIENKMSCPVCRQDFVSFKNRPECADSCGITFDRMIDEIHEKIKYGVIKYFD